MAVLVLNFFITLFASENPTFGNNLYKLINYLTLAIVIVVVAVPEGLPLSIGIALAYSTKKMKEHKILVKNLTSMEVMGQIEEVVTGKTGTMTSEDMRVAEWFAFGKVTQNNRLNTLTGSNLNQGWIDTLVNAIVFNTDARVELDEEAKYIPVGQGTEVSFLSFLQDNQIPIHDKIRERYSNVLHVIPHTSHRGMMTVVAKHPTVEGKVRITVKGAAEKLLNKCDKTFTEDGELDGLSADDRSNLKNDVLAEWTNFEFTEDGTPKGNAYRSILFAYKDMALEEFESAKESSEGFQSEESRQILESELALIAVLALDNPLKDKVAHAVKVGSQGHL